MRTLFLRIISFLPLAASFLAYSGVVVNSTRHLFEEGSREINTQLENKDERPYLIKSWVEATAGRETSSFMVTPPLFRLEGKQINTLRIFPNANISSAPKDRDSVFFFNVMTIPPTKEDEADKNKLQLAVRHRMRLIWRPKAIQHLNVAQEAKKLEWRKSGSKISVKNTTPFFIYFKSVKISGKEIVTSIPHIDAYANFEFNLPSGVNGSNVEWKVATNNGGTSSAYSSRL